MTPICSFKALGRRVAAALQAPTSLPAAAMRRAAAALSAAVAVPILLGASAPVRLDPDAATAAIDRIRGALPPGWSDVEIRWDVVPLGWTGEPACVYVRLEGGARYPHPSGDFDYHAFYKLWLLPPGWEGRMTVADLDPSVPSALYLGEAPEYRVLYRTLGRQSWDEGPRELADALGLDPLPLEPRPLHTIDISAMQVLYRRLDTRPGALERWQPRIWGIAEQPDLIYLELLTWDERGSDEAEDPTWLGELAERETEYLSREVMAAFPAKRGLYLRRLTERSFSDVIVVNPSMRMAAAP
ncbi:MAG TPA: hypothetical protein VKU85_03290 [bacterium]|nr:hypothetical protein [bacterium]